MIGEHPKEVIMSSKEDCEAMADFLRAAKVNVLPIDEPLKAARGFLSFSQDGENEAAIAFLWRFDKPVENIEEFDREPSSDSLEKFKECLEAEGWVQADDPKRLRFGFINYRKSLCRFFRVSFVKNAPDKFKSSFTNGGRTIRLSRGAFESTLFLVTSY